MKNYIIPIVIGLAAFVCLGACASHSHNQITKERDDELFRKIESLCDAKIGDKAETGNSPCIVRLDEVFGFSWEKMYVFDIAVEHDVISKVLGSKHLKTSNEWSEKWYFTKAGEIVHFQEKVIAEIDRPTQEGDVIFEISDSQNKFAVFDRDSSVEVSEMKVDDGHFMYLKRK